MGYFILAFFLVGGALVIYMLIGGIFISTKEKYLTEKQKKKGYMYGIFYKLNSGTELFIVKNWLESDLKEFKERIIEKNSGVESIFSREHFEKQYKELFNPNSLIIRPVNPDISPLPKYNKNDPKIQLQKKYYE